MSLTHENEFEHQIEEQEPKRESWGLTLPFTQHVLTSFDILSQLLSPNHTVRGPGSGLKIEGEIRPRSKSLQQVVRSVMFFEGDEEVMLEIQRKMQTLEPFLRDFLDQGDVKGLLGSRLERGSEREMRRQMIFENKLGSVELKRRKDALSSEKREKVLRLMRELEGRIEWDLRGVEDAMWPRKIIVFDSQVSSEQDEEYDEKPWHSIGRAWVWSCELAEEVWEDGGEIFKGVSTAGRDFLLVWKVHVWVVVLVGGVAFVVAYLHG